MLTPNDMYPLVCDTAKIAEQKHIPLLELLVMVKNAGATFRDVMLRNLKWVEDWTVLDTGSTDGTYEMLQELQLRFPGQLFQEPFTNFRDSRNRLLELSRKTCTYQIILDDTYVIEHGERLREFLELARTAPFDSFDSFSIYIHETAAANIQYLSNRIIVTAKELRYDHRFRIHEIIRRNNCFAIPAECATLLDECSTYMKNRTAARKAQDIQLLLEDHANYPEVARVPYYLAETYLYSENYQEAAKWYEKRANAPPEPDNYDEEQYDAKYKLAMLHHLHLKSDWQVCESLYLAAHEFLPRRSEALFMLGFHYATEAVDKQKAYQYLRQAYDLGVPTGGMNLKLWQHNYWIPIYLTPLCMDRQEYELAFQLTSLYHQKLAETKLEHRPFMTKIHTNLQHLLLESKATDFPAATNQKKWVVFVTVSGWQPFNGETLRTKGLGGSENCMIRLAESLAETYQPIIFCPCDKPASSFQGVFYYDVSSYPSFLKQHAQDIQVVLLQRSTDYMLVTLQSRVYCYIHYHDTFAPEETLIHTDSPYFLGTICLSQWHKHLFQSLFPTIKCYVQPYGIDFPVEEESSRTPHSFVYTSFPNRGLLVLVRDLWPRVLQKWPDARLSLFCDFQNQWLQKVAGPEMNDLEAEIQKYPDSIHNFGWQPPSQIRAVLAKTCYFLYPCTFAETFCLAALEAQVYGLHVITCNLGALPETVRVGHVIPGDAKSELWQNEAIRALDNPRIKAPELLTGHRFEQVLRNWMPLLKAIP